MEFLYAYLVIINAVGFVIMLIDKKKAQKQRWRIPERTLLLIAAVGGSLGMLFGMYQFRHKTKHLKFTLGVPGILVAQLILAGLLIYLL